MTDWRQYWQERPAAYKERDFCHQVGRTFDGGKATSSEELARVVEEALDRVELRPQDRLLDLCCGNGLLTHRLADRAAAVVGVDYSEPMIGLAQKHHQRDGVRYLCGSVLDLPDLLAGEKVFDRAVMFESLQYFEASDLPYLLVSVAAVTTREAVLCFTGVLDAERIWSFYDSPERRAEYHRRRAAGEDAMGHWFTGEQLERVANAAGFSAQVRPQDSRLNTAFYRFDLVLRKVP